MDDARTTAAFVLHRLHGIVVPLLHGARPSPGRVLRRVRPVLRRALGA